MGELRLRIEFEREEGQSALIRRVRKAQTDGEILEEGPIILPDQYFPAYLRGRGEDLWALSPEAHLAAGKEVYEIAVGEGGASAIAEARRKHQKVTLQIEEQPDLPEVSAFPWEMMYDGEYFPAVAAKYSVERILKDLPESSYDAVRSPLRMLMVSASPEGPAELDLALEQCRIAYALAPHIQSGLVFEQEILRATKQKLREALEGKAYDILYFTGHGTIFEGEGALILEGSDHRAVPLPARELADMIEEMERPPALVCLNCCLSAAVGGNVGSADEGRFMDVGRRALAAGVPLVVATLSPIFDESGRFFCEAFFKRLFKGNALNAREAIRAGRRAMKEDVDPRIAQSFYQYMLLSSAPEGSISNLPEQARQIEEAKLFNASTEHYALNLAKSVRRNALLVKLEEAFCRGDLAVGIFGYGGLGKTMASSQIEFYLGRHVDPRCRVSVCYWISLRGDSPERAFFVQLQQLLGLAGLQELAAYVGSPNEVPDPKLLGTHLADIHEGKALLTLDNCESLLDAEGKIRPEYVAFRDWLLSFFQTVGWKIVFTSRVAFSFQREGRELYPIHWQKIPPMTSSERGALVRLHIEETKIDFNRFNAKQEKRIYEELAEHPWALGLLFRELKEGNNLEVLLNGIHKKTGEYAALEYYFEPLDELEQLLMQTMALIDGSHKEGIVNMLAQVSEGQQFDQAAFNAAWSTLIRRGLVEQVEQGFYLQPFISHFVLYQWSRGLEVNAIYERHRRIGYFYAGLARDVLKKLEPQSGKVETSQNTAENRQQAYVFLDRALRYLQQQDVCDQSWLLLIEKYAELSVGRASAASATSLARQVIAALGEKLEEGLTQALGFGVCAQVFQAHRVWNEAIDNYKHALDGFCKSGDGEKYIGTIYRQLGIVYQEQRLWAEAEMNYREAIRWYEQTGMQHQLGNSYHQLGRVYQEQQVWAEAERNYREAIRWKKQTGMRHELGNSYHQLGMVYQKQQNWAEAEMNYREAIRWNEQTGMQHELGGSYHQLGTVYQEQQAWAEAEKNYREAIHWNEQTGMQHQLGNSYHQLGIVYQEQQAWAEAEMNYREAIRRNEQTGMRHELGGSYHQLGRVYQEQQAWAEAERNYREAIRWYEETGMQHQLGNSYHQLGIVYQEQRLWAEAEKNYREAIHWNEQTGMRHELGNSYHQLGRVYEEQQNWAESERNYREAIQQYTLTEQWHEVPSTLARLIGVKLVEDASGHEAVVLWLDYLEAAIQQGAGEDVLSRLKGIGKALMDIDKIPQEDKDRIEAKI